MKGAPTPFAADCLHSKPFCRSGALTTVVREPGFLLGVEPCIKLQTALIHVIEALGTSTSTADFNFDGVVDVDDIEVVLDRFGSSSAD